MSIRKRQLTGFLFFLPALIFFSSFVAYPFVRTVYLSFRDFNWFTKKDAFIGLQNYRDLLSSPQFLNALGNSIIYSVVSLAGQAVLAIIFALLLNTKLHGSGLFRSLFILPWVLPTVVTALAWQMMLHERWGAITYYLYTLGITAQRFPFLATVSTALPTVILVNIWRGYPLMMISFLSALQAIPQELTEAAIIDGASTFKRTIYITLPIIRNAIATIILFRAIWVFNFFDLTWQLTRGGPASSTELLPILIYKSAFGSYRFGEASAIAMLMFMVLLILVMVYFRMNRSNEEELR
ncbi:MAG: sugar ABC transporter permease [Clostridiales bacterium]|nr:sugar ABC transporter permease [Clostridiales bacterium]